MKPIPFARIQMEWSADGQEDLNRNGRVEPDETDLGAQIAMAAEKMAMKFWPVGTPQMVQTICRAISMMMVTDASISTKISTETDSLMKPSFDQDTDNDGVSGAELRLASIPQPILTMMVYRTVSKIEMVTASGRGETKPLSQDSDHDGLRDRDEDGNLNGQWIW